MKNLTGDESRALAFVAGLLFLSAAVRVFGLPQPLEAPPSPGFDLGAHIEATRSAVAEAERAARPLAPGETIDPNTAPATELARLPGVGRALADRIVEDRDRNGPFRTAAELGRVSGVGDRTVERLRPHLSVRAGASLPGRDAGREGVVDVNEADAAGLARLPGIGPVLAARMVAHRDSAGPFRDVDGLAAVPGIGPATVERLRDRVRVR